MKPAAYLVTVMDSHGVTHVFRLAVGQDFTLIDAAKAGKILSVEPVTPGTPSEANEIDGMLGDSTWSAQEPNVFKIPESGPMGLLGIDKTKPPNVFKAGAYTYEMVFGSAVTPMLSPPSVAFQAARFPPCSPLEREARELLVWVDVLVGRECAEKCERDLLGDFKRGRALAIWGVQRLREFVPECMRLSAKDAVS